MLVRTGWPLRAIEVTREADPKGGAEEMAQGLKRLLWKYGDLSVCPEYKMGTDTS